MLRARRPQKPPAPPLLWPVEGNSSGGSLMPLAIAALRIVQPHCLKPSQSFFCRLQSMIDGKKGYRTSVREHDEQPSGLGQMVRIDYRTDRKCHFHSLKYCTASVAWQFIVHFSVSQILDKLNWPCNKTADTLQKIDDEKKRYQRRWSRFDVLY